MRKSEFQLVKIEKLRYSRTDDPQMIGNHVILGQSKGIIIYIERFTHTYGRRKGKIDYFTKFQDLYISQTSLKDRGRLWIYNQEKNHFKDLVLISLGLISTVFISDAYLPALIK